jgi:hypothetical protein
MPMSSFGNLLFCSATSSCPLRNRPIITSY